MARRPLRASWNSHSEHAAVSSGTQGGMVESSRSTSFQINQTIASPNARRPVE